MFMFRNCAVLLVIGSACCFIFGLFNLQAEVEPNACRMTYMFGEPMYAVSSVFIFFSKCRFCWKNSISP